MQVCANIGESNKRTGGQVPTEKSQVPIGCFLGNLV